MTESVTDPILVRAYRKEKTEHIPIWLMRQAGRYLPEYLKVRSEYSINEVINTPELAFKVTMQPLARFPLDAAIIFADLLTPLQGLGFEFDFLKGLGPKVFDPVASAADIKRVTDFDPTTATAGTLEALKMMRAELDGSGTALIGFSGAPFTLSSYMIEAKSNPKLNLTKKFIFNEEAAWHQLQEKLVVALGDYLIAQVAAGAQVIQIFDSWLGGMSVRQYQRYVEPYVKALITKVKDATDVPVVFFATGVGHLYQEFLKLPADVIGVDWRQDLSSAQAVFQNKFALQGNIDPLLLFAEWETLEEEAKTILAQTKDIDGFVFNLGHGILPTTPIDNVERLVRLVHEFKN